LRLRITQIGRFAGRPFLCDRVLYEGAIFIRVPAKCRPHIFRQLLGILDGRAAWYLFIDQQNCFPLESEKARRGNSRRNQTLFAHEPVVAVSKVEAAIGQNNLPPIMRHEKQSEDERCFVSELIATEPRLDDGVYIEGKVGRFAEHVASSRGEQQARHHQRDFLAAFHPVKPVRVEESIGERDFPVSNRECRVAAKRERV
jgi:hypothetical protein